MGAAKIEPKKHISAVFVLNVSLLDMEQTLKNWTELGGAPEPMVGAMKNSIRNLKETIALLSGERNIENNDAKSTAQAILNYPPGSISYRMAEQLAKVVVEVLD